MPELPSARLSFTAVYRNCKKLAGKAPDGTPKSDLQLRPSRGRSLCGLKLRSSENHPLPDGIVGKSRPLGSETSNKSRGFCLIMLSKAPLSSLIDPSAAPSRPVSVDSAAFGRQTDTVSWLFDNKESSPKVLQAHLENLSMTRCLDSWLGTNASDLQWLIPPGMAHQDPYHNLTALFPALDRHGIPHLFANGTPDPLPNRYRETVCPGPERACRPRGTINLKRSVVPRSQDGFHSNNAMYTLSTYTLYYLTMASTWALSSNLAGVSVCCDIP
jgi:hypothetical protein